jgi:type VI secretion system protein ImpM
MTGGMVCGLFGKMPSKRDFVSYNLERPFLDLWEKWLQSGVAASRESLGDQWQQMFLSAPIWRFWLGAGVAGTSVAGAVMPSVDHVGRYFPLSLCAAAPQGCRIPPPPDTALDEWYSAAERFLLTLLEDELPEEPQTILQRFSFPSVIATPHRSESLESRLHDVCTSEDIAQAFSELASADHAATQGGRSYWWTLGGPQHAAKMLVQAGMPGPSDFAQLMGAPI